MDINLNRLSSAPRSSGNDIYDEVLNIDTQDSTVQRLCSLIEESTNTLAPGKNASIFVFSDETRERVAKVLKGTRFSKYSQKPLFDNKALKRSLAFNPQAQNCLMPDNDQYQYVGLDDFANELLVSTLADSVLNRAGIPATVNAFDQFVICNAYSALISPLADFGNMYSFAQARSNLTASYFQYYEGEALPVNSGMQIVKPEIVLSLLKQIVITLYVLSSVEFISGDMKLENILLTSEGINFTYEGIRVSGPLRIRLTDLAGGSVSIASSNSTRPQDIRIYNQIRISRFFTGGIGSYSAEVCSSSYCYVGPNVTDTSEAKINPGQFSSFCDDTSWWTLPDKFNSSISFIVMHSGLPFYRSYDFYIFMVTLMSTPEYYYAVADSPTLRSIWRSLWLEQERPLVRKRVKDRHGYRPSLDSAIDIIRGLRMRCDAVENVKKLLELSNE